MTAEIPVNGLLPRSRPLRLLELFDHHRRGVRHLFAGLDQNALANQLGHHEPYRLIGVLILRINSARPSAAHRRSCAPARRARRACARSPGSPAQTRTACVSESIIGRSWSLRTRSILVSTRKTGQSSLRTSEKRNSSSLAQLGLRLPGFCGGPGLGSQTWEESLPQTGPCASHHQHQHRGRATPALREPPAAVR